MSVNFFLKTLQSDNITLRQLGKIDAPSLFALTDKNRGYLRQFLPWLDRTKTAADTEWFITNSLKGAKEKKCADYGIYYQDELVGAIGFHSMDYENKKTTIGYWLDKEHQGKGIMTRSVKILINFAFTELGLNRIQINCAPENTKSSAIPKRLGFTKEGIARQSEWLYDHFVDWEQFSLIKAKNGKLI